MTFFIIVISLLTNTAFFFFRESFVDCFNCHLLASNSVLSFLSQ